MEQCLAPNPSTADNETEEINRLCNESCISEGDIHVVLQDQFLLRKPHFLNVAFGHFLSRLSQILR